MRMSTRLQVATAACAIAVVGLVAPSASAAIDVTPPAVNLNGGLFFKVGSVLSTSTNTATIPANVTWGASDDVGITNQYGYFEGGGSGYSPNLSTSARQYTVPTVSVNNGYAYGAVDAYDAAGNVGSDNDYYYTSLVQQGAFTLSAGWTTSACNCWSGGSVVQSSRANASAQYQFTGNSIAVIGDYASNRGSVRVYMDGALQSTINTAGATKNRVVIYQKRFNTSQTHTIKLVVASGRVDLDALVVQN